MKVTIDMDLTPEEARKMMGLPDVEPMQKRLMEQLEKQLAQNMSYIDPETAVKAIMPMGAQGLEQMQKLLWDIAARAVGGEAKKPGSKGR